MKGFSITYNIIPKTTKAKSLRDTIAFAVFAVLFFVYEVPITYLEATIIFTVYAITSGFEYYTIRSVEKAYNKMIETQAIELEKEATDWVSSLSNIRKRQ